MKNLSIYILSFLSFVWYSGIAQEKIDENLLTQLKTKQSEEQVSFIVMLSDQVPLTELKRNQESLTRQQLHEQAVTMLQDKAEGTQKDLVSYLSMQKRRGDISEFEPIWIINAILVKAKAKTVVEISQHKDVAFVYLDYIITSILPTERTTASSISTSGIEPGVTLINADCMWAQGYTGAGRLVSHLDTGVDASHPALTTKWRGNATGVTPAEAWFDPNGLSPSYPVDSGSHGTHTMGTILGSTTGDIIGVAYDAEWISAGVIDIGGISNTISNALLAFQWTVDPDGDPTTVDDVPDVSSNSWGLSPIFGHVPSACDTTFWSVIDNVEAATVVVVFAAGNEGGFGSSSLRTPSDRATTAYNTFSVGALDASGATIASYSSRGPSTCTADPLLAIKPEVVARGSSVRSSVPGGGYSNFNGTSMATPHVAGAVALLRQVDPNATVDQIKDALMSTAIDLGTAGQDNNYGHGLIDVCAAAQVLSPCPVSLNITTNVPSGTDTQEASNDITASNTISSGATAIYHAGTEVVLAPGFDALNGSIFRAYIEGCTGSFVSRSSDESIGFIDSTTIQDASEEEVQKMYIAPNPNQGAFSVYFDQEESGTLQILDFKGDLIETIDFKNSTKLSVNIQRNLQGMYFVKVRTKSKIFVEKIIKK
ncbi:S8 family peptidase [Kordia sp.]|uniref:S8 family peptidase n=1 Tax=Kordia sp. TaxID=1965332 RepID=UPI003D6B4217